MKPRYDQTSDSGSDSEDDAPEAVPLSQSKKAVKQQTSALQHSESLAKEKKRAQNRERDQKLKAQAAGKKGKRAAVVEDEDDDDEDEDEDEDEDGVMSRMRKAMEDADRESDEDDEMLGMEFGLGGFGGDDSSEDDEEEFHGFDAAEQRKMRANPNHLPEHLFASASASQSQSQSSKAAAAKTISKKLEAKQMAKKRSRTKPKDVIVGSRVVRSLADTTLPSGKSTMGPSANARKFLDRTLALKPGGNARQRGWERRPASVGSLRTGGPAARFVRS